MSKLRWSCRRGLLENDLFIERFFRSYETTLTVADAKALNMLMDLSDNDLLDLLLRRSEPRDTLNIAPVVSVLTRMRIAPQNPL